MKQKGLSLKQVVNDALRAGLTETDETPTPKFRVQPYACRFKPGIDLDKLNQLEDEMVVEESLKSLSR